MFNTCLCSDFGPFGKQEKNGGRLGGNFPGWGAVNLTSAFQGYIFEWILSEFEVHVGGVLVGCFGLLLFGVGMAFGAKAR